MDDRDPEKPAAAEAAEPVAAPAARSRAALLLGVVGAVLLVLSVVLAVGLVGTRRDLADRERDATTRAAETERLRADLATVSARRDQAERDLAAAQAKLIDPKGLELIRSCVRLNASVERSLKEALAGGGTGSSSVEIMVPGNGNSAAFPNVCIDAEPYLK